MQRGKGFKNQFKKILTKWISNDCTFVICLVPVKFLIKHLNMREHLVNYYELYSNRFMISDKKRPRQEQEEV